LQRSPLRQISAIAAAVALADAVTKFSAVHVAGHDRRGAILPVTNHDYSLGLAHAAPTIILVTGAVLLIVIAATTVPAAMRGQLAAWIPGVLIGGCVANLADRALFGAVHDFISTRPVIFNVADVAILAGVVGVMANRFSARAHGAT
jgi:lipoprotein signal peptidase